MKTIYVLVSELTLTAARTRANWWGTRCIRLLPSGLPGPHPIPPSTHTLTHTHTHSHTHYTRKAKHTQNARTDSNLKKGGKPGAAVLGGIAPLKNCRRLCRDLTERWGGGSPSTPRCTGPSGYHVIACVRVCVCVCVCACVCV